MASMRRSIALRCESVHCGGMLCGSALYREATRNNKR